MVRHGDDEKDSCPPPMQGCVGWKGSVGMGGGVFSLLRFKKSGRDPLDESSGGHRLAGLVTCGGLAAGRIGGTKKPF
jgi:hypothetical protein